MEVSKGDVFMLLLLKKIPSLGFITTQQPRFEAVGRWGQLKCCSFFPLNKTKWYKLLQCSLLYIRQSGLIQLISLIINIAEEKFFSPYLNPTSPEHFVPDIFSEGGVVATPHDYQYRRSYNPKCTTSVQLWMSSFH